MCAINIFLRKRHLEHLKCQVITLTVGLSLQFFLLSIFFSLPVLRRLKYLYEYDEEAWKRHLTPLSTVLVLFCATVAVGLFPDTLPNIFMLF
jgi:hypothetical protein